MRNAYLSSGAYDHDRINKYENKKQPSNRIKIAKNYV